MSTKVDSCFVVKAARGTELKFFSNKVQCFQQIVVLDVAFLRSFK